MSPDQPQTVSFARRRSASLAAARAQLRVPAIPRRRSLLPALGAAFLAACAGVSTAAAVILGGTAFEPPSHNVYAPVSHIRDVATAPAD